MSDSSVGAHVAAALVATGNAAIWWREQAEEMEHQRNAAFAELQAERELRDRLAAALIGAGMPMADGLPCFCYYPFETEPHRAACRAARAALDSDPSVEGG